MSMVDANKIAKNGYREYAFGAASEPYSLGYVSDGLIKSYQAINGEWYNKTGDLYVSNTDTTPKAVKTIEICGGFETDDDQSTWNGDFTDIKAQTVMLKTYDVNDSIYGGSSHIDFSIGTLKSKKNASTSSTDPAHIYVRFPNGYIFAPDNEVIADASGINCGSTGITVKDLNCGYYSDNYSSTILGWGTVGIIIDRVDGYDRISFYVNGKLKVTRSHIAASSDLITFPTTITNYLYESFTTDVSCDGYRDDIPICAVRLYNRVLNDTELCNNALQDVQKYGFKYI